MKSRQLLLLLASGAAIACWPLAAQAKGAILIQAKLSADLLPFKGMTLDSIVLTANKDPCD